MKSGYAIVVPLSGSIQTIVLETLELLKIKYNIEYLYSRSKIPHITILAGIPFNNSETELINLLIKAKKNTKPFTLHSYGLGIFVLDSPLIYLRWKKTQNIQILYDLLFKKMSSYFSQIETSCMPEIWQPKTSLAYKDTKKSNLIDIITIELSKIIHQQSMKVEELFLLKYDSYGEYFIKSISLKKKNVQTKF